MNLRTIICVLILFSVSPAFSDENVSGSFEEFKQNNLIFNKTVFDEEIIEYFELFLKYQPNNLIKFKSQTDGERKLFLKNYRKLHNDSGTRIPILRGAFKKRIRTS